MDRKRLSLDDPAFAGRLRHTARPAAYIARPLASPMKTLVGSDLQAANPSGRPVAVDARHIERIQQFIAPPQPPASPARPPFSYQPGHTPELPWQGTSFGQATVPALSRIRKRLKTSRRQQPLLLYGMAAVIFVIGLTVSLNGLRANRQVSAQVQHLTTQSAKADNSDDSGAKPSVQKPAAADIGSYQVAPNLPRYVDITKLGVHARVLSMGVTGTNQLKAPGNVYDAGWYNASAQPGQPGGMLLDGHISSWTTKGVFYGLSKLVAGDQITITRGDGQKFTYGVVKKQLFDADKVDMASMLVSQDPAKPGLNLISCSGEVIPGTNEFDKRLVIYAVMQ